MNSQVIFVVFTLISASLLHQSSSDSLYSIDDALYELDSSNFESIVFGKSNIWMIQFYKHSCGHCIETAPIFKQFASNIETWKNVVDIGVVDCAEFRNVELCRNYVPGTVPSIQIFPPFVNEAVRGKQIPEEDRYIEGLESDLVQFIDDYQNEKETDGWPDLKPLEAKSLEDVRKLFTSDKRSVILFVDNSNSDLGEKVILDLSSRASSIVRRVLKSNEGLINDLNSDVNSALAVAFKVDKDGKQELLRFPADTNATYVRDTIFKRILGTTRVRPIKTKVDNRYMLHMTDLENALNEMLYGEISGYPHIYNDRLRALKSFILMLKNYFPGTPPVMKYLSKLSDWVSYQRNITGKTFSNRLDKLQTTNEYLPGRKSFVQCKGSEPNYRGFPCSVWTLFHTLTVQAYIIDEETGGGLNEDVMTVLPTIKNYIMYLFTCDICVQNFFKMDQNIGRYDNTTANVVMWLWAAHNRVNKRLSGRLTEDPQHPKVQFPIHRMCPNCRVEIENSDELEWDEDQVLRFLKQYYSKENIVISGSPSMGLKFNHFLVLNLLLWVLQYSIKKIEY